MSQVGTIKGYHDGSTYSLADIYDEKTFDVEIGATKVGDSDGSCKTIRTVWFDLDANSTTGIMFADDYYPTRKPALHTSSSTTVSPLSYITTENTAFGGYGLRLDNSHFFHTQASANNGMYATLPLTMRRFIPLNFGCMSTQAPLKVILLQFLHMGANIKQVVAALRAGHIGL